MTTATPDARARLLAAAVEAFGADGFHATTTRSIAARAGMSPAAVYVHHRSKEDLLYAVSREGHLRLLRALQEAVDSASSSAPADQLEAFVRVFVTMHATDHTSARVVNDEYESLTAEHRADVESLRGEITTLLRGVVDRGVAAGVFDVADPGAGATVRAILSLGMDVARWYPLSRRRPIDEVADEQIRLVRRLASPR